MLKYVESAVTFSEIPDEISLCLNLSLCPNYCPGCSESYLAGDIGTELTKEELDKLISENLGISLVCLMGGDNDHKAVIDFTGYIHDKYKLKVGMYSGQDQIDLTLANVLDYYKIGSWKMPQGDSSTWSKQTCGPISFPNSNQLMFKREGDKLINITERFREYSINNLEQYIIN